MKRINIFYWIFTILLAASTLMSGITATLRLPSTVAMVSQFGYPLYFIPFLGVAKILGVIAILVPGFPKIREWAYAGLTFDLIAATYSQIAVGTPLFKVAFMLIFFAVLSGSYMLYHKRLKAAAETI